MGKGLLCSTDGALAQSDCAASILYLIPHKGQISETFIRNEVRGLTGIDIVYLDDVIVGRGLKNWRYLVAELGKHHIRQWYRVLRFGLKGLSLMASKKQYDLIHVHFAYVGVYTARVASRIGRCPWTVSVHAWDVFVPSARDTKNRLYGAAGICVCNMKAKEKLRAWGLDATLIHHGVVIQEGGAFDRERHACCRLLCVGRLVEKKGFIYALQAIRLLCERGEAVSLQIIGDGPLRGTLQSYAQMYGLPVLFSGEMDTASVYTAMRENDLLLCPSIVASNGDMDGIPNVILEAFQSLLPVIASDAGSISEVVMDGVTGVLIPPRASHILADMIQEYGKYPSRYKDFTSNAFAFLKKEYDVEKQNKVIQDFLCRMSGCR